MNYLDTFDIAGSSTPPAQPEQTLNEEVSEVIGQFSRFWGGFTQQSRTALELARKDLGQVVTQAQKELTKLTEPASEQPAGASAQIQEEGKEKDVDEAATATATEGETSSSLPAATSPTQSLFSRLQSVIPANVAATVQNNLPESLKHGTANIDVAHLRSTLSNEFQRVQGLTKVQAEEYMHRSELLIREVVKEAGDVLKDAVKVIPPEDSNAGAGLIWDGTDMWMLSSDDLSSMNDKGKGKERAVNTIATRAESLLKRLKTDPEIIKHDPEADKEIGLLYTEWLQSAVDSKEGGIINSEWTEKISQLLEDPVNGSALQTTKDSLVPSQLTEDVFWKRYFFRAHQIRTEEQKRQVLIQDSTSTDDDFSWEDDEEEDMTRTPSTNTVIGPQTSSTTLQDSNKELSPHSATTPANASPRESSEDSFDVVSTTSENVGTHGEEKTTGKPLTNDSDGDSDWE